MSDLLPISAGRNPVVFLAAPRCGLIHPGSAQGVYQTALAESSAASVCGVGQTNSSLLAHGFNMMLADALDRRDAGDCTHFAMIHADIEPLPELSDTGTVAAGWLDILLREMGQVGAVAISAVTPIKEPGENPRTSTAIFDDANPWTPKQFLHLLNRSELPATFTGSQVCRPGEHLGINTGCMLLDLRWPHWDGFAFEIRDRIVKGPDGKRIAQSRPEDWEMSRYVAAHGGTVAATWAVRLWHHGSARWPNF